jgi:uncharacterized protein YjgD (DUF1641 family)
MEDLKDDLMRGGNDLYNSAIEELEEVHDQIQTGDILFLGKKLLRNINNITQTFELLENAKGFIEDFKPVSRELVFDVMNKMDEYDRKGYFQFLKELEDVAEKVVTSFTVDDVKALGDNIVTILNTIKELTQPDMLIALNNAVTVYKNLNIKVEDDVSYFSLLRKLNTPEMKKGLDFGISFLKSLAEISDENTTKKTIN